MNVQIARWTQPDANILVFTDNESFKNVVPEDNVRLFRLNTKGEEPMFERVVTMAAYVSSSLFNSPTVFLILMPF